ncbi:MAG: alpha-ketoacid dehydrogenase subunit beta, partial [Candidatus Limnocylindrales bacterium]
MAELTYRAAIAEGIAREMTRDPSVVMIGEDIGAAGGVFKLTEGLFDRFGPERVRDTPISEQAIVGAAMGAAMTGLRPIAELMFSDFFAVTWDMVANQIAKTRYMTNGQISLPLVLRTANGAGLRFGAQHSQSIESWAMAIPGLKVVAPSSPADVVGLMVASIRDPDPVIFCEHKALFATQGEVPDGEHVVPLGQARIARAGTDCT